MRTGQKRADGGQVDILDEFAKPARWKRVPTVAACRVFSRAQSRTVYHNAGGFMGRSTTAWFSEGGFGWERGSLVVDDARGRRSVVGPHQAVSVARWVVF